MKTFPEFEEEGHAKLIRLDEDAMKSKDGKEKWRAFITSCVLLPLYRIPLPSSCVLARLCSMGLLMVNLGLGWKIRYEKKVKDHNFGSLIRMNCEDEYSETNTIFGEFAHPRLYHQ